MLFEVVVVDRVAAYVVGAKSHSPTCHRIRSAATSSERTVCVRCESKHKIIRSLLLRYRSTIMSDNMKALWRELDAVCFDVDSTVCTDEAIDRLAEVCGVADAVKEWYPTANCISCFLNLGRTSQAMTGTVLFQDALAARLDIMRPSKAQVWYMVDSSPLSLL